MLHLDNALAHRSSVVSDFLEKHGTVTVQQPPYSPDLAPGDYFLFPKLKMRLKAPTISGDQGHQERIGI